MVVAYSGFGVTFQQWKHSYSRRVGSYELLLYPSVPSIRPSPLSAGFIKLGWGHADVVLALGESTEKLKWTKGSWHICGSRD